MGFALLALAGILLASGADLFTDNASAIARRFGIEATVVVVVLAGAEPEELVTSVLAAARGHPGMAAGDAIGASLTVLTLVLGLAILAGVGRVDPGVTRAASGAALLALLATIMLADGSVRRWEAFALSAAYVPFLALVTRPRRDDGAPEDEHGGLPNADGGAALLGLLGIAVTTVGGWFAVTGAERVVGSLDLTDGAVGLTLVGLATSAELLALVWAAARRGADQLVVGAVVGSVAFNVTLTLGISALVRPVDGDELLGAAGLVTLLSGALGTTVVRRWDPPRPVGLVLLVTYIVFTASILT